MLYSNKKYFESCIKIAQKLFQEKLYEDCINYIEKTASFGWFNFSGYYKSEKLEVLLSKIQQEILTPNLHKPKKGTSDKILHICSEVYTSGGHSKLLYNWIKNDKSNKHSVLSTRLAIEDLKEISLFYLPDIKDIDHFSVKSESKIKSAQLLNQLPLNDFDAIVLHIHPDETITNLVLSQPCIATPVYFVNHADHVFWLGTSIADMVLQIRESNISIDVDRRGIAKQRHFFLPIPVETVSQQIPTQAPKSDYLQILSTGTSYKYNPNREYNFLKEAYKIVEENKDVIFNIVGIDQDSNYGKEFKHDRIILHGIVSSSVLAQIEKNTDIYIEGFPMASFTALLQTALQKIPFVLHYNPIPLFKLFEDDKKHNIIYPSNLEEWHNEVKNLIREEKYRTETREKQYDYILNNFSIDVWKSRITDLYEITKKTPHTLYKTPDDIFYAGANELILVTIDKRKLPHFSFTENLSFWGKCFVFMKSFPANKNIDYFKRKK